jgi:hypothetical protein
MSLEVDVWYVKLADGDVERVTLDELDEAFQKGQIDENSMVLASGSDEWMKLSVLLQLSDATPPPPPPTPAPQQTAQPRAIQSPMVPAPAMARPPSSAPGQPLATVAPPGMPQGMPPGMPPFPVASTLRPLSVDLGADDDVDFPRAPSRKGRVIVALGVAAALGAAGFVVVKRTSLNASADTSTPNFAAAAALPAPETPAPTPQPPAAMPMQASMAGPSSVMDPTRATDSSPRLSDAQKQKLLDTDKKKTHEHTHGGGAVSHSAPSPKSKSSSTFTTTGSKYDPLNANF